MGLVCSKLSSHCSKLCSNSSTHDGGHTVIRNNTLGGEADGPNPSDPRTAAADAAQRRLEAFGGRGVVKGGKLAQQLKAQNKRTGPGLPEPEPERLVWD